MKGELNQANQAEILNVRPRNNYFTFQLENKILFRDEIPENMSCDYTS